MASGNTVGETARTLWPQGRLINGQDLSQALRDTRMALAESPRQPLFEATFEHDGILVRADLLIPVATGYRVIEVKSSASVKDYHLPDAAVQSWVVRGAGLETSSVEIAHIDTTFMYGGAGDYRGLFKHQNISDATNSLQHAVPQWANAARNTLASPSEPDIATGDHCHAPFECPFFSYCSRHDEAESATYPITELPRGPKLVETLAAEGFTDLSKLPEERLSKPIHRRIHRAVITGEPFLDSAAARILADLPRPWYYLDFETIQFAVPIWAGTRPYSQIPFQWSCHIEHAFDDLRHQSFLAEGTGDPRRAFVKSLLPPLGSEGTIFVYNAAFERTRLEELQKFCPDRADELGGVIRRLYDLLPLTRDCYYHRDQHGSWSIKDVLRTIDADLAYDGLTVKDGGMAQEVFVELLGSDVLADRRQELRAALLAYCGRDTLALVRLARRLRGEPELLLPLPPGSNATTC